jgi:hypothetical protein
MNPVKAGYSVRAGMTVALTESGARERVLKAEAGMRFPVEKVTRGSAGPVCHVRDDRFDNDSRGYAIWSLGADHYCDPQGDPPSVPETVKITRVLLSEDGLAVSPNRAPEGTILDVVFVRLDGWSIGATKALAASAHELWPHSWVSYWRDGQEWPIAGWEDDQRRRTLRETLGLNDTATDADVFAAAYQYEESQVDEAARLAADLDERRGAFDTSWSIRFFDGSVFLGDGPAPKLRIPGRGIA